jgi:hypothetical protein
MKISPARLIAVRNPAQPVVRAGKMLMLHRQLQNVPRPAPIRRRTAK